MRQRADALRSAQLHARIGQSRIIHPATLGTPCLAVESGPDLGDRPGQRLLAERDDRQPERRRGQADAGEFHRASG